MTVSGLPWRVVHIIGSLDTGGAESQLSNYLQVADCGAFRHTLICLRTAGVFAPDVERRGISVELIPMRSRLGIPRIWALARWLRRNQVAIAHTHTYYPARNGRLAAVLAGTPVIVTTEHGKELWKNTTHLLWDRLLERHTCRHIAVSRDVLSIRRRRERIPADKIEYIPNGVVVPERSDASDVRQRVRREFGFQPDEKVIGTVGRVVEAKGYPVLIEALARIVAKGRRARWLLVGDGPHLSAVLGQLSRLGLEDCVVSAGMRRDVPELMTAMDVFAMPSIREGLPLALLEAMAAARPIVVSDVGGMPEAIENEVSGLVVPPNSSADLAAAIMRLINDRDLAERVRIEAHATARERFSITAVARRIEDVYRACLAEKGMLAT